MLTNLVIDVPVPQDGARPLLEKDDEDNANLLVRDITWIYWLDDVRKQAVANFLCSNYTNLFRLQVITEGSFIAPPDVSGQSAALYFQTPPSDAHGISNTPQVNHSTPAFSTAPYNTVNYDGSIDRHGSHDQTYSDIFNDLIILPDEDSALEKAKKDTDPRYHGGLEIMQNYEIPSNSSLNLTKISLAIRAGYAIIRPDLEIFTKTILSRWLRNGLWPTLNSARSQSDDIKVQCSEDMMYLGIEKDPETKTMLRRIARIRLYYWYEEEKKKIQHSQVPMELDRGIDIRTRSIDVFLEYFHADWENAEEERRKYFRSRFHIEKNIGKRWCELVQYLGEGILVICGKEMDTQMNSNNFPKDNVHALATFVSNCYSEAVQVSQCFIPVVKSFIRKGIFEEQEFTQWNSQLDWDFMGTALEKVKSPPSHQGAWTTFPDLSKTDLTRFIREALI